MNNSAPLVSIIIPVYNRETLVTETLDSILNQSYQNWECIIIDDRSTDNTTAILEKYKLIDDRFSFFERPINKKKGANTCRNYGLELSKGDFIIFFDSDDLMKNNHIEIKINAITKNEYDYVITRTEYFNSEIGNETLSKIYQFNNEDITHVNYVVDFRHMY